MLFLNFTLPPVSRTALLKNWRAKLIFSHCFRRVGIMSKNLWQRNFVFIIFSNTRLRYLVIKIISQPGGKSMRPRSFEQATIQFSFLTPLTPPLHATIENSPDQHINLSIASIISERRRKVKNEVKVILINVKICVFYHCENTHLSQFELHWGWEDLFCGKLSTLI